MSTKSAKPTTKSAKPTTQPVQTAPAKSATQPVQTAPAKSATQPVQTAPAKPTTQPIQTAPAKPTYCGLKMCTKLGEFHSAEDCERIDAICPNCKRQYQSNGKHGHFWQECGYQCDHQ